MSQQDTAVSVQEDGITVEAGCLAAGLGLTVEDLRAAMRQGIVYGTTERGIGDDAGRKRLTFRYRARSWVVVVEPDGTSQRA